MLIVICLLAAIHRTLSAILLMGNMVFKQEARSDQATLPDNTIAQKVRIIQYPKCSLQYFAG